MLVAMLSEADAWTDGGLRIAQKLLRELERTESAIGLRNSGPDEHGGLRTFDRPIDVVKPAYKCITTLAVVLADLRNALLRTFKRLYGGDLDRREGAVIELAFDAGERADQVQVTAHETHSPARHVVALRECEKFHGDLLRPGNFHDG